jgi:ATP-dependent DNA helicase DinG
MSKKNKLSAFDLLSDTGPIAAKLSGFHARIEQQVMAEEVATAIENKQTLVCEAGTGTGKTLGYLVPVFLSKTKTIVSTATKTLQDQLFRQDIPLVKGALASGKTVSLLKGRQNYLCIYRFELNENDPRVSHHLNPWARKIKTWSKLTKTGDLEEISNLPDNALVRQAITSTAENCLGADCPSYKSCHVVNARKEAAASDIVVVNHHLLFADMVLRETGFAELLPDAGTIILDEAHRVPDIASLFFSRSISGRQISVFCQDSIDAIDHEAPDMVELRNIVSQLLSAVEGMRPSFGTIASRADWLPLKSEHVVNESVNAIGTFLKSAIDYFLVAEGRGVAMDNCLKRSAELIEKWELFRNDPVSGHVHWVDVTNRNFTLYDTPISVGPEFSNYVDKIRIAWIMTSATLSVDGTFDYFKASLGINEAMECLLASPFDYKSQALLYTPECNVAPSHEGYEECLIDTALSVLAFTKGHAFILFTSFRSLNKAAGFIREKSDYPLFVQGESSRGELLDRFKRTANAVLLGTSTFWEGVDVRGAQLRCVIIDKLPFAVPSDPLVKAKIEASIERGENPFTALQIPYAITVLKQGAGRLIRDVADRGVLMIGDNRLTSSSYGKVFIRSLPPMRRTSDIDDVEIFFS